MRDVLITGGVGSIGFDLVEQLLNTNCNITILDLASKEGINKVSKIKDRIRIVYGDIEDKDLVLDLVKRNDFVINYAGVMPPLANLNEGIANSTNYTGTKNIVDSIREVNPECVLIYPSFISIYGETKKKKRSLKIDSESTYPDDPYSISVIQSEQYIKDNIKNFCILRMPIVLTKNNYFLNHMKLNVKMDFIAKEDLNKIILDIMRSKKIYGKIFNISGFKINSNKVVEAFYKKTGSLCILNRKVYYGEYADSDAINEFCNVKYTSLNDVLNGIKKKPWLRRFLKKIINLPKYWIFKIKTKKTKV